MKSLYVVLGSLALALGVTGIFIPLLPTTPFLLLSAWLYCKGSPKLYGWLMSHPVLGTYIRNYRDRKAITLRTKIVSLTLLWATILFCVFYVVHPLWLKIMLGVILVCVSWHLISFRTIYQRENLTLRRVRSGSDVVRVSSIAGRDISSELTVSAGYRDAVFFLLRAGGQDVGYIAIRHGDGKLLIREMYLLEEWRGMGFAREALIFLDYYCRYRNLSSLSLSVDEGNGRALAFYSKQGFVEDRNAADSRHGYISMLRPVAERPGKVEDAAAGRAA